MKPTKFVGCLLVVSLCAATGCEESGEEDFPLIDIGPDITQPDTDEDADDSGPDGVAVPLDLSDYLEEGDSTESAAVYQVESTDQLADGPVVEARPGDWVLENDRVRLFLEHTDRAMSACPWGGNIVDAQYKRADDTWTEDVTGEICLMVNVGLTFAPEDFTVVDDGADGGAAVLAINGRLEHLDFMNVSTMAEDYAPGILDSIALDPDRIIDATLTRYFILHPGDSGVRVVTAIRNEEADTAHMAVGHVMRGGGHASYFNPLNRLGGWGYTALGPQNLQGDPLPFMAYVGSEAGYAYVPEPDPTLPVANSELPIGGVQVAIAGVSASLMGRSDVLATLLSQNIESLSGLHHLEPNEVGVVEHWEYFGDENLASLADPIYETLGIDTATIAGTVTDSADEPVAGVLVTAVDDQERAMNQTRTDEDGEYSMTVPAGDYDMRARLDGRIHRDEVAFSVEAQQEEDADLVLKDPGTINVTIRTPDGEPTPGRVTIICADDCPDMPTSREQDVTLDSLPTNFTRVVSVGVDGEASIDIPAGDYQVSVSRGLAWSVWPNTAPDNGGHAVSIGEGEAVDVEAEIAKVIDTSGALSADFHVHAITSPDSVVRTQDRVLDFMGEGVDVLVSTDHDYISDYAPEIERQGAGHEIASVVGQEITTPHLGHFNAFPLERDPEHRRGGAVDWARGADYDMTPAELFEWMDEQDGDPTNEQIKQINHPDTTIPPLQADVLRGITLADPEEKRVDPSLVSGEGQDTGLWSDDFTAIEMMNGNGMGRYWAVKRWWLSMVSRGFAPTATAVTDTHKLYSDLGGSPRSFVFVGDDHDTPETFDAQALAEASNAGRAVGTNGPFFRVELENSAGETAGLGETLAASDGDVTAHVTIDVPEWIHVDTIDVYSNLDASEIVTEPGEQDEEPIPPTSTHAIDWEPSDLTEAAAGEHSHMHRSKTVDIPMTIEEDAYVVIVVRGDSGDTSMWPVFPKRNVKPRAFSNPVYVDADGGGYDNPPLADLAETPLEPMILQEVKPEPFEGPLTPEKLGEFLEEVGHHQH